MLPNFVTIIWELFSASFIFLKITRLALLKGNVFDLLTYNDGVSDYLIANHKSFDPFVTLSFCLNDKVTFDKVTKVTLLLLLRFA